MRVLVSFGRRYAVYGDVVADALRLSVEALTAEVVVPEELDVVVASFEPHLIIADRAPKLDGAVGWVSLPVETGRSATFSIAGELRASFNPSFEDLLALVEEVRRTVYEDRGRTDISRGWHA
ncbi:MAG: hypothetical protein ACRDTR_18350 [Rubrobacter sp.]